MFDVVILGGGPAGYTGAIRAAKLGMSVALVEDSDIGGTCLNRGCIPTKSLLRSSSLYASREEWGGLGVFAEGVKYDEAAAYAHKDETVRALRGGVEKLLGGTGVQIVRARGRIAGVGVVEADGERIEAGNILVATGSVPARIPVKGAEHALTSDEVLTRPLPDGDVAIVGGGVIGAELACYFADCGRKVTVIECADRILPFFGKEISVQSASALRRKGVRVCTSSVVTQIDRDRVAFVCGGKEESVDCAAVVMAAGRRAVTQGIGLENVGIVADKCVQTDGNMLTSAAHIYAAGDVTGGIQLAHYAAACAVRAVEHMAGEDSHTDLSVVPSLVYTHPEIAVVGRTEGAAKTGKFMLGANGKSLINGSNRGFVKIYCDDKDVIVGAELFGDGVTETVGELSLAVSRRLTAKDVAGVIHAHPTVYESVAEACEDVFGLATHKL